MQIPCNIQFKFTFLSDTKYRKMFSALYTVQLTMASQYKRENNKNKSPHTTILDIPAPSSSSTEVKETIVQTQTSEWEKADGNSDH